MKIKINLSTENFAKNKNIKKLALKNLFDPNFSNKKAYPQNS